VAYFAPEAHGSNYEYSGRLSKERRRSAAAGGPDGEPSRPRGVAAGGSGLVEPPEKAPSDPEETFDEALADKGTGQDDTKSQN
jgi:hypothetical protein